MIFKKLSPFMKYIYGESFLSERISPENEIESEEKVSGKRKTPAKGVIYHKRRESFIIKREIEKYNAFYVL